LKRTIDVSSKWNTSVGRFIKDSQESNTLKIVDVQYDDAGVYSCRASTDIDFDESNAKLVVQDRPNRPKITKVNCNGSVETTGAQPFAVVQWEAAGLSLRTSKLSIPEHLCLSSGDNNARILYYELQYNTPFQSNDWISIPVEQNRESFTEVKSADGSIKLEPKITSTIHSDAMSL
jgi:hypothetical protein